MEVGVKDAASVLEKNRKIWNACKRKLLLEDAGLVFKLSFYFQMNVLHFLNMRVTAPQVCGRILTSKGHFFLSIHGEAMKRYGG